MAYSIPFVVMQGATVHQKGMGVEASGDPHSLRVKKPLLMLVGKALMPLIPPAGS